MLAYLKLEIVRTLRNRRFVFFVLGFPVLFYVLFTKVLNLGGDSAADTAEFARIYMISMAAYGAMASALSVTGQRIALERSIGWNDQLRLTPLSARSALLSKLIASLVLALPSILLVSAVGMLVNDVSLSPGAWLGAVGLMWIGALPFAAIGVVIGYFVDSETAQVVTMMTMFLLAIVGGLWINPSLFPDWLRYVSDALPAYHYAELGWRVADGHAPRLSDLAVLVAYLVVFGGLALVGYRRTARR